MAAEGVGSIGMSGEGLEPHAPGEKFAGDIFAGIAEGPGDDVECRLVRSLARHRGG